MASLSPRPWKIVFSYEFLGFLGLARFDTFKLANRAPKHAACILADTPGGILGTLEALFSPLHLPGRTSFSKLNARHTAPLHLHQELCMFSTLGHWSSKLEQKDPQQLGMSPPMAQATSQVHQQVLFLCWTTAISGIAHVPTSVRP